MDEVVQQDRGTAVLRRYNILDTPREPQFDEIAAAAALLCKVPIAAITFIDRDRQWTKAAVGVETLTAPAEGSICAHASSEGDIFVVEDISADPRFAPHPYADMRPPPHFYAGVPIETSDGHRIGTLCILDVQARSLEADQKVILRMLARQVTAELERRRALAAECSARRETERLLAEREELVARNDILMREIDHRVKNSLQLVASMLGLQARRMPDRSAALALEEAQQRIGGVAAMHEQLYRVSDSDRVDLKEFLGGLCASLAMNKPNSIRNLVVEAERVIVGSKRAMKAGLVLNELVTNAFKHAYEPGRRGDIRVTLTARDEGSRLVVGDDGVGLPAGFSLEASKGLGMRFIRSIVDQFGGTLTLSGGPGATFTIDMPPVSP